jgi:hypothetical protein
MEVLNGRQPLHMVECGWPSIHRARTGNKLRAKAMHGLRFHRARTGNQVRAKAAAVHHIGS